MSASESTRRGKPPQLFQLSLDTVERINQWRAQYILIYMVWLGIQLFLITRLIRSEGESISWTVFILSNLLYIAFAFRFIQVLRAMRYTFWMYLPACIMGVMVPPGILVVAYIDRGIVKTLRRGLDARDARLREQESVPPGPPAD